MMFPKMVALPPFELPLGEPIAAAWGTTPFVSAIRFSTFRPFSGRPSIVLEFTTVLTAPLSVSSGGAALVISIVWVFTPTESVPSMRTSA